MVTPLAQYVNDTYDALATRGETFGVIHIADIEPAMRAGITPADFALAQSVRCRIMMQRIREQGADPDRTRQAMADRLEADAGLGFTRD